MLFCGDPVDNSAPDCYDQSAGWSSQVARWAHNPKVASSNLAPATNKSVCWLQGLTELGPLTSCVHRPALELAR